jgi:N utilization substance protein A
MANTINSFMSAIDELCDEKGLKREVILEAVEAALAAAYRKDYGKPKQVMKAKIDPITGSADIFRVYEVVETDEEIEETERQLTLSDAKKLDKKVKVGGEILIPMPKEEEFGRIAAQTAKQVIIQRLREAERDMVFAEYKDKEGQILNASVQQIDGRNIVVTLGKANGILFPSDQIRDEKYYVGQRLKVFLKEVSSTVRGPQILVSRTDEGLVKGLFESEVPEISAETVEIKSIAREAGSRTKIAVIATEEGIDPVGSCVGQRGTRVQAILAELADEKIDIVLWDEDAEQFIMNSLSPAKTETISISSKDHKATVSVSKENLSLAIGKGGQNVRLASKLTGWGIDIVESEVKSEKADDKKKKGEIDDDAEPDLSKIEDKDRDAAVKEKKVPKSKSKKK